MIRLPNFAFSSECVTWMIVVPASFNFVNSSMISRPWLECRLPVGSSARMSLRLGDHGARDADQLLLPAGELPRIEILLADHAEPVERVGDDRLALRLLHVPVRQRDVEVLGDGEIVDQVVLLEDEADVLLVQRDALLVAHRVHRVAEEEELARPRAVEHAEDREQRRLAGARRAHDRHELARLNVGR